MKHAMASGPITEADAPFPPGNVPLLNAAALVHAAIAKMPKLAKKP
jgi:hypothetical protein